MKKIKKIRLFVITATALMIFATFGPTTVTADNNYIGDSAPPHDPFCEIGPNGPGRPSGPDYTSSEAAYTNEGIGPDSVGDKLKVEIATGNVHTDLEICLGFIIRYNSLNADVQTPLGFGWTHNDNIYLEVQTNGNVIIVDGYGWRSFYEKNGPDFTRPMGRHADLFFENGQYVLKYFDGSIVRFNEQGSPGEFFIEEFVNQVGQMTTFEYDPYTSLLTTITNANGHVIELGYEDLKLMSVTHPTKDGTDFPYTNPVTVFSYIGDCLVRVTDPLEFSREFSYDENNRMTYLKLKNGISYSCDYVHQASSVSILTELEKIYIVDGSTKLTYDDTSDNNRNVNHAKLEDAHFYIYDLEMRILKDKNDDIIATVTTCSGFPEKRSDSIPSGIVYVADGNGNVVEHTRNVCGRRTRVQYPNGDIHRVVYSDGGAGRLIREINAHGFDRNFEYDQYGNLRFFTNELDQVIEYRYENEEFPTLWTSLICGENKWNAIYENGWLKTLTDPLDNTVNLLYEFHDVPYDSIVKKITLIDRDDDVTKFEYDTFGNLIKRVVDPDGLKLTTSFVYDGYMTSEFSLPHRQYIYQGENVDSGTSIQYQWDAMGRLLDGTMDYWYNNEHVVLTTSFTYDGEGNIRYVTNPKSVVSEIIYDYRGRVSNVIEDSGGLDVTTSITYDGNDNVETITDPEGYITKLSYDSQNRLEQIIDAEQFSTWFDYDAVGNLVLIDREVGFGQPHLTVQMDYDALDRLTTMLVDPDELCLSTQIEYVNSEVGSNVTFADLIHKITDAEDKVTYLYYDDIERVRKVVQKVTDTDDNEGIGDLDDAVSQFFYYPGGDIEEIIGPEGEITQFFYDAAGRLIEEHDDPEGFDLKTFFEYDYLDNLIQVKMPNGNVITSVFDKAGRKVSESDSLGELYTMTYDENGNIRSVKDAYGDAYSYWYDTLDRLISKYDSETKQMELYKYDDNDRLVEFTAKNDIVTRYVYDGLGQLTSVIEDAGGADERTTSYLYNGLGLLTYAIDDLGGITGYSYDAAGRLIDILYPDSEHVTFGLDGVGNVVSRMDQNGLITTFEYDDLHCLTDINYPDKGSLSSYDTTYTYDRSGRMLTADNPFASWSFEYDALGRLENQKQKNNGLDGGDDGWYETGFDYFIDENVDVDSLMKITYPGEVSREIFSAYDARLREIGVDSIPVSGEDVDVAARWQYNSADKLTTEILLNSVVSEYSYDGFGRLVDLQYMLDDDTLYHDEYGYDVVGNRVYTLKHHDLENSECYEYDNLNRLIGFKRGSLSFNGEEAQILDDDLTTSTFLAQKELWDFDSNGNWEGFDSWSDGTYSHQDRTVNDVNEYTEIIEGDTTISLSYDKNGNLLDDGTYLYEYDVENHLVRVVDKATGTEICSFMYGPLGNRVVSDYSGDITHHLFLGVDVIQERSSDGLLLREFIDGANGLLAMVDYTSMGKNPTVGEAEVLYYLKDVLGSTVALTDSSGDVVERYSYDPFGETVIMSDYLTEDLVVRDDSLFGNPFMWTGQRFDGVTGLYYFWARSYSPELGRWLQRDPLGYIDGMSLYEYVRSSPLNFVDPLGLRTPSSDVDAPFAPPRTYVIEYGQEEFLKDLEKIFLEFVVLVGSGEVLFVSTLLIIESYLAGEAIGLSLLLLGISGSCFVLGFVLFALALSNPYFRQYLKDIYDAIINFLGENFFEFYLWLKSAMMKLLESSQFKFWRGKSRLFPPGSGMFGDRFFIDQKEGLKKWAEERDRRLLEGWPSNTAHPPPWPQWPTGDDSDDENDDEDDDDPQPPGEDDTSVDPLDDDQSDEIETDDIDLIFGGLIHLIG